MRKLVESTFVSLDGVIGDPQVWGPPYWDEQHSDYARDLLFASDALLLGRLTYEGFAQAWPPRSGDIADRINGLPKHVASRSIREATWNATIIDGDVAEEVAKLKEQPGENILKYGTGVLDRPLLEHELVDEYHFWIFPVLVGSGQRLTDGLEGSEATHLELVSTTQFDSGIVVNVYAPK